ncbi:MAG TPA: alanine--glyoxylate aminotransferase family protein [Chloroflexota bacterium]|nr:alanine--glyoxylate aminotransferase family protein [Chloroflexota bacterium]
MPLNLRIPGPTPVPDEVLAEMGRPMINHRGPEFASILGDCTEGLKFVFQTKNDVIFYPSSGSGTLESMVVNTLSPGDRVLGISIGSFGKRFAEIARRFGADVTPLDFEWGLGAEPDVVRDKLRAEGPFKAVLVTHNETSTGVTNDVRALADVIKPTGALMLVDAVSSLGGIDIQTDNWGLDCVGAGSQKELMCPPGLGFVAVSKDAWEAHKSATMPRFYWDWTNCMAYQKRGENPYTPPVSLYFALRKSLQLMEQEGLQNIFRRHEELAAYTRQGMAELGLKPFSPPRWASTVVSAAYTPEGISPKQIQKVLEDKYEVTIAIGQEHLVDKIIRIGHMGYVKKEDLAECLACLREALIELGHKVPAGATA